MTDDPNLEDDVHEDVAAEEAYEATADEAGSDAAAIMEEAKHERLHRQAFWHLQSKQLFAFLFANCMFFASGFAAWTRAGYNEDGSAVPVDPSLMLSGLDTIRGSLIFALALYGFWTAIFNIWHAQMKVWPYMLAAMLALWVGIGGFMRGVGGEQWDNAKAYLDSGEFGSKSLFDDLTVPLGVVAPGFWLLTIGGLVVVWVIINGLMQGSASAKAAAAEEAPSGRRRRR